jgi:hypothetical protein
MGFPAVQQQFCWKAMEGCIGMGIGLLGCLRGTGDGEYTRLAADTAREAERLQALQHPASSILCYAGPAISFFDKLTQN